MKRAGIVKTIGVVVVGMVLCVVHAYAQPYRTAVGLRAGGTTGIALKHNYEPNMALEGLLGFFRNGISVTGLLEIHTQAFDVKGLRWYYGPGAHIAFYSTGHRGNAWRDTGYRDRQAVGFGINGVAGIEYRLPDNVPIIFSFEFKPFLEIDTSGSAAFSLDPGLGIKIFLN